ncbi:MAG: hypothetical protein V4459_05930 [Pseudomonadota bacterium]
MANENGNTTPQTVIVERGSTGGGVGTILIGLALLVAVAIGAYFVINSGKNDAKKTDAISRAADKVGDSAQKVANKVAP